MEHLFKVFFLRFARSRMANRWAKRYGLRLGASRFVAGETIEQAVEAVRLLNNSGRMATLDYLGEFVSSEAEVREAAAMCIRTLDAIHTADIQANLSLKLTSLGLDLNPALCQELMESIVSTASDYGLFVRIDMEDYSHCQPAIDLLRILRQSYSNVGIVIQAYLYRSEEDVKVLGAEQVNLRFVKGAYQESAQVAFPLKEDVDANMIKLIGMHLISGSYTAIATHDEQMILEAQRIIANEAIPVSQYEFQMLYGICEELQLRLVRDEFRVRVYVPFGVDWFGYFMRRLAERPANIWFVLKNFFK
ncbi:proline dehydrogenase family protein [Paenibacillus pini]